MQGSREFHAMHVIIKSIHSYFETGLSSIKNMFKTLS